MQKERGIREFSRLLGASMLAVFFVSAAAAQTEWAARCSDMSSIGTAASEIADHCEAIATDQFSYSLNGAQKALAFYHAADANLTLGSAGDTERLKRSAGQIDASLSQLPNFSPFFSQNPYDPGAEQNKKACKGSRKSKACKARAAQWQASADRVQYDRAVLKARAYKALAAALDSNPAAGFNAPCSSKSTCLESALAFLAGQSAVIDPYEAKVGGTSKPEGPEVARFNILRADLLEFRGRPADRSEALSIYEDIAIRGATGAERDLAQDKVEALALKLGDEAFAGSGAGQSGVQGLNDAGRYYQRALLANPDSYLAAKGKASTLQALAGLSSFPASERRSYYRQAEAAWAQAASLAGGGDRA
ncbi:MAG TPA: hypothetical protein VGA34_05220, partial [Alteraurantiacibacter sp.]